jgi:hypothetical protein
LSSLFDGNQNIVEAVINVKETLKKRSELAEILSRLKWSGDENLLKEHILFPEIDDSDLEDEQEEEED